MEGVLATVKTAKTSEAKAEPSKTTEKTTEVESKPTKNTEKTTEVESKPTKNTEKTTEVESKPTKNEFQYEEVKGDLFSCPKTDSLAHCVSADFRMGKGIAVHFKKKFMGVPELTRQKKGPGSVAVLKRDDRYIYYMVTKVKYSHKPTYDTLKKSLNEMKTHCQEKNVTSLSMPRIGCGLDGLVWHRVESMIHDIFKDTDVHIKVYSL